MSDLCEAVSAARSQQMTFEGKINYSITAMEICLSSGPPIIGRATHPQQFNRQLICVSRRDRKKIDKSAILFLISLSCDDANEKTKQEETAGT